MCCAMQWCAILIIQAIDVGTGHQQHLQYGLIALDRSCVQRAGTVLPVRGVWICPHR